MEQTALFTLSLLLVGVGVVTGTVPLKSLVPLVVPVAVEVTAQEMVLEQQHKGLVAVPVMVEPVLVAVAVALVRLVLPVVPVAVTVVTVLLLLLLVLQLREAVAVVPVLSALMVPVVLAVAATVAVTLELLILGVAEVVEAPAETVVLAWLFFAYRFKHQPSLFQVA
jgi:hypothetical protein